jgi:hypothetical protein
MPPATKKRESYSFFEFPSVHYGQRVRLNSRSYERTLIELETTPGITGWRKVDQEVPFVSGGKEMTTVLQLVVSQRVESLSKQSWRKLQLVRGTDSDTEKAAIAAGRACCEREHIEHVALSANRPTVGPHETQNRRAAHAWLVQVQGRSTRFLEQRLAQEVAHERRLLSDLAELLGVTPICARLVFIRCWLRQMVSWDIGQQPIGQDLLVAGVNDG